MGLLEERLKRQVDELLARKVRIAERAATDPRVWSYAEAEYRNEAQALTRWLRACEELLGKLGRFVLPMATVGEGALVLADVEKCRIDVPSQLNFQGEGRRVAYFLLHGRLGEIEVDGKTVLVVSPSLPPIEALVGKGPGKIGIFVPRMGDNAVVTVTTILQVV